MLTEEQAAKLKQQLLAQLERLPKEQVAGLRAQIEAMNAEELERFVRQQQAASAAAAGGECFFCQLAEGKVETIKLYEDDAVLAILDIAPASLGHTLLFPKANYQFLFQLPDELLLSLSRVVKLLMPALINATKAKGVSVYIAQGAVAGQRAPHLVINLIPRYPDDKLSFDWPRQEVKREELSKLAEGIIARLQKSLAEQKELEKEKKEEEEAAAEEAKALAKMLPERIP